MPRQPSGTLSEVAGAFRLRADAVKAEELFQFRDKLFPASTSVAESAMRIQSSPQFYGSHLRNCSSRHAIPSLRKWIFREWTFRVEKVIHNLSFLQPERVAGTPMADQSPYRLW